MYTVFAVNLAVSLIANGIMWEPGQPFGGFLLTLALLLWMVLGLLSWRGKMPRLKQTFTALFGTDAVLTLINLPFIFYRLPEAGAAATGTDVFIAFTQLGLMAWSLLVIAHILRQALDLTLHVTSIIAVTWFVAAIMVHNFLIGATAS